MTLQQTRSMNTGFGLFKLFALLLELLNSLCPLHGYVVLGTFTCLDLMVFSLMSTYLCYSLILLSYASTTILLQQFFFFISLIPQMSVEILSSQLMLNIYLRQRQPRTYSWQRYIVWKVCHRLVIFQDSQPYLPQICLDSSIIIT